LERLRSKERGEKDLPMMSDKRRELEQWYDFLIRYAQDLEKYHNLLFSLCYLEGTQSIRKCCHRRFSDKDWSRPWICAEEQWVPEVKNEFCKQIEIKASITFPATTCGALASSSGIGYIVEELGKVECVDLNRGRILQPALSVSQIRPLRLTCSKDGRYLAVAYESGRIEVFQIDRGDDGFKSERSLWSAECFLPEYEPPFLIFLKDKLWWQDKAGEAVAYAVNTGTETDRIVLPGNSAKAELAYAVQIQKKTILLWRTYGNSSVMVIVDSRGKRIVPTESADPIAMIPWGDDGVAISFSNRLLCFYSVHPEHEEQYQFGLEAQAECFASEGGRLWWISSKGILFSLNSPKETPQRFGTPDQIFPAVCGLAIFSNGNGFVLTRVGGFSFHIGGKSKKGAVIHTAVPIIGGYVAFSTFGERHVLIDGVGRRTMTLDSEKSLQFDRAAADGGEVGYLFAVDGTGLILVEYASGPELIDPSFENHHSFSLPDGIISAAGKQSGGFWLADIYGRIFSLDKKAVCREEAFTSKGLLGPPRISSRGSIVVWTGTRTALHSSLGTDAVYVQIFFKVSDNRLIRIGEREYTPAEGVFQLDVWDESRGRLIGIWHGRGNRSMLAKIGTPEDFLEGNEKEYLLPEIRGGCEAAALSENFQRLFMLSSCGVIHCFDMDTLTSVATIATSAAFTCLKEGIPLQKGVLAIAGRRRVMHLRCMYGGKK